MVYVHNEILLSHKRKEILPFVTPWIDLEDITLSEIGQTEKQILYDLIAESKTKQCPPPKKQTPNR